MDYKYICDMMEKYDAMSAEEVQKQIKPIIQSYDKTLLSEYTGIAKDTLYNLCKKVFVARGNKPSFILYTKIMNIGHNHDYYSSRR